MDSLRLRGLWIVDTDTLSVCAERRYATLERSHQYNDPITRISSQFIVESVLEYIGKKVRALEECGLTVGTSASIATTRRHLLGAFASPQLIESVFIPSSTSSSSFAQTPLTPSTTNKRNAVGEYDDRDASSSSNHNNNNSINNPFTSGGVGVAATLTASNTHQQNATGHIVGPFVAFSARRGVRVEVPEDVLRTIGSGGLAGSDGEDWAAERRAMIDEILTSFEAHPQYAPAENLIVIAAPLVAERSNFYGQRMLSSSSSSTNRNSGGGRFFPNQRAEQQQQQQCCSPALRRHLVSALLALQSLLGPFVDDTLVIGVEGSVLANEVEGAMSVITESMGGWDVLCARRVVSDRTWRCALETVLAVGIAMGRVLSVVADPDGPSSQSLPHYFDICSTTNAPDYHDLQQRGPQTVTRPSSLGRGVDIPRRRARGLHSDLAATLSIKPTKSLQAQSLFNVFDASSRGEGDDDDASANFEEDVGNGEKPLLAARAAAAALNGDVDDEADVMAALELGPNPTARAIDIALHTAANFQTSLFIEQHVASQVFGNAANNSVVVTSHLMFVPPARHSTRFSNRVATVASLQQQNDNTNNLLCLLGGAPPPHASLWATSLNRAGPSNNMIAHTDAITANHRGASSGVGSSRSTAQQYAGSDAYIRRNRSLVREIVGAPEPRPMSVAMTPALILDKKRLIEEGLTTGSIVHAMGLGRFIATGPWRIPALSPVLPTTSSVYHLDSGGTAGSGKLLAVSASESYPPITAIALSSDFAASTKALRDAGIMSVAGGVEGVGSGAALLTGTAGTSGFAASSSRGGVTSTSPVGSVGPNALPNLSASVVQRPKSILTMVHEVPRAMNTNTHNPNPSPAPNSTSALRCSAFVGSYALLPVLDAERARRLLQTTDFGQGVGIDAPTPQAVLSRTRDELSFAREHIECLLCEQQGHILYRLDLEITVDVGGVASVDVPKLDVVFKVNDHASVAYYHLNVFREDSEINPTTGVTSPSGTRNSFTNITSQPLSDTEFMLSFVHGAGARVRNGTTFIVKGIVVCDVSDRAASSALPPLALYGLGLQSHHRQQHLQQQQLQLQQSLSASGPPSEASILSAVTVYSSASLHFTLLAERPFLPGSCVLADPTVMGKCLVGGAMGDAGAVGGSGSPVEVAKANPASFYGASGLGGADLSSSAALMADTLDQLQKKIRAVAFGSKGTASLVERQLTSALRLGLPTVPFPADGDSPVIWRKSELTSPAPITAAVIVRSHPDKGFTLWNYSGDV